MNALGMQTAGDLRRFERGEHPIGEIVEGAELPEVEVEEKPKRTRKSTAKKAK